MAIPKFLRLPHDIAIPIGLAVDPTQVSLADLKALVAHTCLGDDSASTAWMDTELFTAWYAAAAAQPLDLAAVVVTHDTLNHLIPTSSPRPALSVHLHLEWALFSRFWWDAIFAKPDTNAKYQNILKYADALVASAPTST